MTVREGLGLFSDLPRYGEAKVALHLFDRRSDPSFEEGIFDLAHLLQPILDRSVFQGLAFIFVTIPREPSIHM